MLSHHAILTLLVAMSVAMVISGCGSEPGAGPTATPDIPATVSAAVAIAFSTPVAQPADVSPTLRTTAAQEKKTPVPASVALRPGYCGRLCDTSFWQYASLTDVQAQLDEGADVNATDSDGWTPLHFAAVHGHADIIALLAEQGADINARAHRGNAPSHLPAIYDSEIFWVLFYHGADITAKDNDGNTILHYAALSNNPGHIKRLIINDADIGALNDYGQTPCQRLLAFHNSHCYTREFTKLPYCQAGINVKSDVRRLLCH